MEDALCYLPTALNFIQFRLTFVFVVRLVSTSSIMSVSEAAKLQFPTARASILRLEPVFSAFQVSTLSTMLVSASKSPTA